MNTSHFFKLVTLAGSALFLTHCGNKENSAAGTNASVALVISGNDSPAVTAQNQGWGQKLWSIISPSAIAAELSALLSENNESVTLTHAWIRIKEIEFKVAKTADSDELENSDSDDDSDEIKFRGPYTVDLLSDTPSPIDTQTIPVANYRRIKFKIHHEGNAPDEAPADLDDHSILLQGTVGGRSFSFLADDEEEVEISGPSGVEPSQAKDLLVVFRFAEMIEKIDMSSVTNGMQISQSNRVPVANACPLIDESADDLYTCFKKGIETNADFGRDDNDDGDLDSENDDSSQESEDE